MLISSTSFWLVGKPRHILVCLAQLSAKHKYVSEVIAAKIPNQY